MNTSAGQSVRVACDVGGTFTDVCVLNEDSGEIHVAKTPTTVDPIDGVLNGIDAADVALNDIALFSHGTTLATNALITRRFPPALMVTTKGFRDVIEIRRGTRDDLWDTYKEMAPPYLARAIVCPSASVSIMPARSLKRSTRKKLASWPASSRSGMSPTSLFASLIHS
ncbi:MAG: hypothetical protein A49_06750 [Methyloceanibacter sp.]|nr:MAG: hypothetical protein A49_06750 [Methyloceanibacter sp.]